MTEGLRVDALYVHPIKSCAPNAVSEIRLDARGPIDDRRWMLVDGDARFVSQRSYPALQTVSVCVTDDGLELSRGSDRLSVTNPKTAPVSVRVWRDEVAASDAGDAAADWMSAVVGAPVRLVRQTGPRTIDSAFASGEVGFADGFPLLVTTSGSVDEIARRALVVPDARRFRPNIVLAGPAPFEEDDWLALALGDVVLDLVKPCTRCLMVNVDPETAEAGREPMRSLATYRRSDLGVIVGQNAVHRGPGCIRVGQPVRILERKSERSRQT